MAKQSGLGDNIYIAGYDLSGDVSAVTTIRGSHGVKEVTGLDKSAVERILLRRDGEISMNTWWNTAALAEHAALSPLTATAVLVTYCRGTTRGSPAACLWGRQVNYDPDLGDDGSLAATVQALSDGYGLDWGIQLTAGKETIASAGNSTGADLGAADDAAKSITSNSVANPTVVTCTGHGMITGDSVTISGVITSSPTINGDYQVTRLTDDTFTVPVNVTVGGTGGSAQKSSTNFGASAYLQVFTHGSNTITVHIEHSADNGVADAFADVAGLAFTVASGQTAGERVATTVATAIVKRYARIVTAGTFASAKISCVLARNQAAPA